MNDQINLDDIYGVDDELQAEVDKAGADPFELTGKGSKDGFCPTALKADPTPEEEEEGVREKHYQNEMCEVTRVQFFEHDYEGGGHTATVYMRVVDEGSPNVGRELDQRFYLYATDRERQAKTVARITTLLKKLGLKIPVGKNGLPSPIKGLEQLKDRRVKVRLMQGYQHPWNALTRSADTSEPKTFRKRVSEIGKL